MKELQELIVQNEEKRKRMEDALSMKLANALKTMASYFLSEKSDFTKFNATDAQQKNIQQLFNRTLSLDKRNALLEASGLPLSYHEKARTYRYAPGEELYFPEQKGILNRGKLKAEEKYFNALAHALTIIPSIQSIYDTISKPSSYATLVHYDTLENQAQELEENIKSSVEDMDLETLKDKQDEIHQLQENIAGYLDYMHTLVLNIENTEQDAKAYQYNVNEEYTALQILFAQALVELKDLSWKESLNSAAKEIFGKQIDTITKGRLELEPDFVHMFDAYLSGITPIVRAFHDKEDDVAALLIERKTKLRKLNDDLGVRIQKKYDELSKEEICREITKYQSSDFDSRLQEINKLVMGWKRLFKEGIETKEKEENFYSHNPDPAIDVDQLYALVGDLEKLKRVFLDDLNELRDNPDFTEDALRDKSREELNEIRQQLDTLNKYHRDLSQRIGDICKIVSTEIALDLKGDKEYVDASMTNKKLALTKVLRDVYATVTKTKEFVPDPTLYNRILSALGSLIEKIGITLEGGKLKTAIDKSNASLRKYKTPEDVQQAKEKLETAMEAQKIVDPSPVEPTKAGE